jgi:hypothetical protein
MRELKLRAIQLQRFALRKAVYFKCNLVYSGRYWRKRMKIASYNLSRGKALNIGAAYLAYQASVFTGFSSFLLSRGSMAAPTAK